MPATVPRVTRIALRAILACVLLLVAAYASAFAGAAGVRVGRWLMALGASGLVTATMALGALRGRADERRTTLALWGTFAVTFGALATGLIYGDVVTVSGPRLLGLPLPAAIVVYGVGAVPLLVLPFVYARAFDESRIDADLIRRRASDLEPRTSDLS